MNNKHEVLGKGLEHIAIQSRSPGRIIKIPRLDWIFAQHLLGINASTRTEQNIEQFQRYFGKYALTTSIRTIPTVKIPLTDKYVFDKRQIIIQEEMVGFTPLEGTMANLERYRPQLEEIAKQNRLLYETTGFSLDFFSSEHLFKAIGKFATDDNYWGLPNLFEKDGEIRISDFGLFQLKEPRNLIDGVALINLGIITRLMGSRLGIDFLPPLTSKR